MPRSSDRARASVRAGKSAFIRPKTDAGARRRGSQGSRAVTSTYRLVTLDNFVPIAWPPRRRRIFQVSALSTKPVGALPTEVVTGNGESGFDSGEGA